MKITLNFGDIESKDGPLEILVRYIDYVLNIDLSTIPLELCPISGLKTVGKKHLHSILFDDSISKLASYFFFDKPSPTLFS